MMKKNNYFFDPSLTEDDESCPSVNIAHKLPTRRINQTLQYQGVDGSRWLPCLLFSYVNLYLLEIHQGKGAV